jgi:nucleotide-binding universal stress UspA family protein
MRTTRKFTRVKPALRRVAWTAPKLPALTTSPLNLPNILVPVDFSKHSRAALDQALALASLLHGTVRVLFVVEHVGFNDFDLFPLAAARSTVLANVKASLHRLIEASNVKDAAVLPEVRWGVPWKKIIESARENKIDLIVIPTHGRTAVKRFFVGSTTEQVLRHASCPLLVLRAFRGHITQKSKLSTVRKESL